MSAAMMHLEQVNDDPKLQKQLEGRIAVILWGTDSTIKSALNFVTHVVSTTPSAEPLNTGDRAFGQLMLALRVELLGPTSISADELVSVAFIKKLPTSD